MTSPLPRRTESEGLESRNRVRPDTTEETALGARGDRHKFQRLIRPFDVLYHHRPDKETPQLDSQLQNAGLTKPESNPGTLEPVLWCCDQTPTLVPWVLADLLRSDCHLWQAC